MATIYPKDYFKQLAKKVQKASCFVIMPFDPKFREIYDLIKETLESEQLNIECKRGDDFHQPHIIETILQGIAKSEFIIADVTGSNPNVFYELGLAHCHKDIDKVIILTQDMNFVPFDLRQFRCIVYEQSIKGSKLLTQELTNTFNAYSKDSFRFKIIEDKVVPFNKRLVGKEKFLYEISFECVSVGLDGIKLQVHFIQCGVDKSRKELETQWIFLGLEENQNELLKYIPWNVTLLRTDGTEAIITLEKADSSFALSKYEK